MYENGGGWLNRTALLVSGAALLWAACQGGAKGIDSIVRGLEGMTAERWLCLAAVVFFGALATGWR